NSTCSYQCNAGYADCVSAAPDLNGCETHVAVDALNCGACGVVCNLNNANAASCNGTCSYTCKAGFSDCVKNGADTDGCETATTTTANCGGCGVACGIANANSALCNGTSCSFMCKNGFADCMKNGANTDGCETPTTTTSNCGGCGVMCMAN